MGLDGLAVVDKAAEWTSHDVVAKARRLLGERRIGHAGTLDPGATGLLLLGVGRSTRLLRFLGSLPKSYVGEMVLGVETTTLDADGEVTAVHDMSAVTLSDLRSAARRFVGSIEQVPPMVSAVKVDGRRLYELARAGVEIERRPRPVEVFEFELDESDAVGVFRVRVGCSSGTYIRTLVADVARALGGGAHLRNLRRTAIGSFTLDEARPIEQLTTDGLLSPADALRDYPSVSVVPEVALLVGHGRVLPVETLGATGQGPWAVLDEAGALLAVYERLPDGTSKPAVVLCPGGAR